MPSFEKLVEVFESRGFTGKEAIKEAKAESERDLERERIKLQQHNQFEIKDVLANVEQLLNKKINVFGFGEAVSLAHLALGVFTLSAASGGFYAVRYHQRATRKFFNSLLISSENELSKVRYSVLPRGQMTVGIEKTPIQRLNLRDAVRSVALVGDNRSGKTIFLANSILNDMFPWWYRYTFPPRGLFLTGSQQSTNIQDWLKSQIATTEKENPWSAVADLLSQRRQEQRVRLFFAKVLKTWLPPIFQPQPAIIVVDQAEELLRAYRADFLVGFYDLAKKGRDNDLFRLVLVINSQNSVNALKLMNGGNMFSFIQAPKVSREAVVDKYGEDFAKIFDACDCCIGVALDFQSDGERPSDMPPAEYAAMKKEKYIGDNCLIKEITREEYNKAREHTMK